MNKTHKLYLISIIVLILLYSCEKENQTTLEKNIVYHSRLGTFIDERDSIEYRWVEIGEQIWMAENLRFQAGRNYADSLDSLHYGVLYSQYTAKCCACPDGWRLPTYEDWRILGEHLGGKDVAGAHLKGLSSLWASSNSEATNYTKFNALPGGYIVKDRYPEVPYEINDIGESAYFWYNSSHQDVHYAYARMRFDTPKLMFSSGQDISYNYFFHTRCIKE